MTSLYVEKYVQDENFKWIVFIHGIGGNLKMWKKQINNFKNKYNLLFIDLPGHGKSVEGIANKGIKKFEDIADIIVKTLKENNIEKATFICASMGTLVFGGILKKYPEVVYGAVLSDAIVNVNIFFKFFVKVFNKIKFLFTPKFILTVASKLLLPLKNHKLVRTFYIRSGEKLSREEFMAWLNLICSNIGILDKLKNIDKNTLFVMGSEDFTLINGVKRYIKHLKNVKLNIISNCGHICCMLKWREFNEISSNFVDSLSLNY